MVIPESHTRNASCALIFFITITGSILLLLGY